MMINKTMVQEINENELEQVTGGTDYQYNMDIGRNEEYDAAAGVIVIEIENWPTDI